MSTKQWILIAWLALSGLTQFVRGIVGTTRTYTELEAFLGVLEVGLMIWLVASL